MALVEASTAASEGQNERARLVGRASVVGAGTLLSRILGLGRDMALAAIFTREETDAFFVAFTIPNALRQLLGEGAVSSAVVPVLSEKLATKGEEDARSFFARIRGASVAALVVVTMLGVFGARWLADLFAGGYRGRPDEFERTVTMTRLVFPYIFFMGTAALGMAALNAKKRFAVAAFAPGLLNVAFLVSAFALPARLAAAGVDPAYAMCLGALLGGALQVAAQWPALRRLGYATRPIIDFNDPGVRDVLRRIAPMTFGIGVYYVDLVLSRRFLSELGPGAQSYFSWAMRVCDFPQGIFVMALSTAALPSLATLAAKGEQRELGLTYAHGMNLAMFVAIPASVALVCVGHPLVTLLFERGQFGAGASAETARALAWQGGAIWTVAAVRQTVPVFYALGDTRTPVVVSALDLCAFIALAVTLKGPLGHVGISIAVAGSSAVQMLLLLLAMRRRLNVVPFGSMTLSAFRTLVVSLLAGGSAWGVAHVVSSWLGTRGPLPGASAAVAFGGVFLVAAWGARSPELGELLAGVRRRLRRS
jgi:putative peptidoglycan lipid II flippase